MNPNNPQIGFKMNTKFMAKKSRNLINVRERLVSYSSSMESPWVEHNARLVLQDGSVFSGISFGAKGTIVGEVVFNTFITGYQEILTDPSYYKQFVCFTHPHIGNTGINHEDDESETCWMKGCIVREYSSRASNYRSNENLCSWLERQGVVGISDVDT